MEPLNQDEGIINLEMLNGAIIEAPIQIHQNANMHMQTINQDSFNQNQDDGQYFLPSSVEMQCDYSQCESDIFLFSTEQSQENISLDNYQIESDDAASFLISTEEDLCDESQTYQLGSDILNIGMEEETTNSEFQNQNEDYDIEQPSCSNVINSNINKVNHSNQTVDESKACEICNKKFQNKSSFERHMLIHTGKKPFSCKVCNFKCNRKSNLQRHLKIHSREKPFICGVCRRGFSQKADLQTHVLYHTKTCSVCNKQFKQTSSLYVHMRIHTGEKPFICIYCGRGFTQKVSMKKHMLTHEKPKYFK